MTKQKSIGLVRMPLIFAVVVVFYFSNKIYIEMKIMRSILYMFAFFLSINIFQSWNISFCKKIFLSVKYTFEIIY